MVEKEQNQTQRPQTQDPTAVRGRDMQINAESSSREVAWAQDPTTAPEKRLIDRTEPQGEEKRINRIPTPSATEADPFENNNFDNTRDPQQIADDNISQYVTGRPT